MKPRSSAINVVRMSIGRRYLHALSGVLQLASALEKNDGSNCAVRRKNETRSTLGIRGELKPYSW